MADNKFIYNDIPEQKLIYANQLTIKAWNDIINKLRIQANMNASIIDEMVKNTLDVNNINSKGTIVTNGLTVHDDVLLGDVNANDVNTNKLNARGDVKIGYFGKTTSGSTRPLYTSSRKGIQVNGSAKVRSLEIGFTKEVDENGNEIVYPNTSASGGELKVHGESKFYDKVTIENSVKITDKLDVGEGMDVRGSLDLHRNDLKNVQSIDVEGTSKFLGDTFSDKFKPYKDKQGKLGSDTKRFAYGYIGEIIFYNYHKEDTNINIRDTYLGVRDAEMYNVEQNILLGSWVFSGNGRPWSNKTIACNAYDNYGNAITEISFDYDEDDNQSVTGRHNGKEVFYWSGGGDYDDYGCIHVYPLNEYFYDKECRNYIVTFNEDNTELANLLNECAFKLEKTFVINSDSLPIRLNTKNVHILIDDDTTKINGKTVLTGYTYTEDPITVNTQDKLSLQGSDLVEMRTYYGDVNIETTKGTATLKGDGISIYSDGDTEITGSGRIGHVYIRAAGENDTSVLEVYGSSSGTGGATLNGREIVTLGSTGKLPTSILPSYVDDVLEYESKEMFPTTGEAGKIYVDMSTNLAHRWSGSNYVEISPSLALGETSSTAFAGDRGAALEANISALDTKLGVISDLLDVLNGEVVPHE